MSKIVTSFVLKSFLHSPDFEGHQLSPEQKRFNELVNRMYDKFGQQLVLDDDVIEFIRYITK